MKLFNTLYVISRIVVLLCFIPASTIAQENISGILKDKETGQPVRGATIQIDSTFYVTSSDENGKFSFSETAGRNITLVVSHIAYNTEKFVAEKGKEIPVQLTQKSYMAEEVNISATRVDNHSAVAFTNIDKTEIEKHNLGQDLPFLLNLTTSVVATSDAGTGIGYTGLRIRGSDATRINVNINGIPVNDAESHQVYWVDLPDISSSIENIQIQRGIGSSTNGAGSFGGSINIMSSKLSAKPFGTISSSAGSYNTFKNTVMFGTGLLSDVFAIEGRVSEIKSDGYIDRASGKLQSYYLSGGYYGKKNSLRAIAFTGKEKTYQAWYGVPKDSITSNRTYNPAGEYYDTNGNVRYYDNQTDNYQQDYYQLLYSHEFNNSLIGNFALHYTRGRGYYEEYVADDYLGNYNLPPFIIGDSTIENSDVVRQLWLSNHFYGLTWSIDYNINKINIKAGGAANKYSGIHYGELIASEIMSLNQYPIRYYKDDAKKSDISFFARTTYSSTDALKFYIDLQERIIDYSFYGFDDNYLNGQQNESMNFFNPKAGLSFKVSGKTQLYLSAGAGHKEPVRDDFVNSTPSNRPEAENMIDYETGIRYNTSNVLITINGYYMNYYNQLVLTGKINDVGEYIRENVKDSYRAGIEFEGEINITQKINFKTNLTLSKNRIKEYKEYVDDYDGGLQIMNVYTNSSISFSPEIIAAGIIGFRPFKNFSTELSGKYVGNQYLDNTSNENRKLDSYLVNDLHLAYLVSAGKIREISFRLSINNIFNTEYISNGYSYSGISSGIRNDYIYYFPQAKRNIMAGITIKI